MSRIGKKPVSVPKGVSVDVAADRTVVVKGPKGTLNLTLRPEIEVKVEQGRALVSPGEEHSGREVRAYHGLTHEEIAEVYETTEMHVEEVIAQAIERYDRWAGR